VGLNGQSDTIHTIPSTIVLQDVDIDWFYTRLGEISGVEFIEDVKDTFTQYSDFTESPPLTEISERRTEDKHVTNTENYCDDNPSCLINSDVDSLINTNEVKHDHHNKGQEDEEVKYPGMCVCLIYYIPRHSLLLCRPNHHQ
jgi:hypothetical protein